MTLQASLLFAHVHVNSFALHFSDVAADNDHDTRERLQNILQLVLFYKCSCHRCLRLYGHWLVHQAWRCAWPARMLHSVTSRCLLKSSSILVTYVLQTQHPVMFLFLNPCEHLLMDKWLDMHGWAAGFCIILLVSVRASKTPKCRTCSVSRS